LPFTGKPDGCSDNLTVMNIITSTEDLSETHEPHWLSRGAFHVLVAVFFFTETLLGWALYQRWYWLALPLVLLCCHLMHGLLIGFHEASHGLLRTNRRLNEIDGIILGVFSFMSFSLYRATHQTHHAYLATERDEELWPFVLPGTARWKRVLAALLELTAGLLFTPCIFLRSFLRAGSPIRSKKVRGRVWAELVLIVVVWICILVALARFNAWRYFLWMYLVPAYLAANLQSWRKYIEHVGLTGPTVKSSTRSIVSKGWPGRLLAFSLLHEPYHGVHHQRAGLPHAELPQHAAALAPTTPDEQSPYPSYRHALLDLLRSLVDPRVGAQWRTATPSQT
jgi:fatty acid desaturase